MSKYKKDIEKIGNKLFNFGNASGFGVRISNDEWGETCDELLAIARKMDKHIDELENKK